MTSLAGTGALVRLALRRDRIYLPIWIALITLTAVSVAASTVKLYPTAASRVPVAAAAVHNTTLTALYGNTADWGTLGGLATSKTAFMGGVLVVLMSIFTVVRHTRAEEETGRLELVSAGVVGRYAPLTASLIVTLGANLVLGALVAASLIGSKLPAAGSVAFGLGLAAVGWMFTAVAAVATQLTENARTANGIAAAVLGASYLLRAAGDAAGPHGPAWMSWLSPLGWMFKVRAYGPTQWWLFGPMAALVVVLVPVAYALAGRRDLGAGLIRPRPGPAEAAPSLRSPLALAWRLHRGSLLGWTIGYAALGAVLGSLVRVIGNAVGTSDGMARILQQLGGQKAMTDAYISTVMGVAALVTAVYAIQTTLRLRTEETSQRAEPVLATRVGRIRWAAGHLTFALLGSAVLMLAVGLAAGLTAGLTTHQLGSHLPRMVSAALVQVPAAWTLAGIAMALFGLLPRLVAGAWAALAVFFLLGQLGPLLKLKQWAMDISPFTHTPKYPGGTLTATPLIALVAVTALLAAIGLLTFRRRDIG